jgi:hypothetical protein
VESHPYERFKNDVKPVLDSKIAEFRLFNYEEISREDLWHYLLEKKWRKPREDIHLYEITNDILQVKVSDCLAYLTVKNREQNDWFSEAGREDLKKILGK